MSAKLKIFVWSICILCAAAVLFSVGGFVYILSHIKPHYEFYDVSVWIFEKGSEWQTECGTLSFENGVTDRIQTHIQKDGSALKINIGHSTNGTLKTDGGDVSVTLELSDEGPYLCIYEYTGKTPAIVHRDDLYTPAVLLETWEITDAYETDTQVILELEVKESTYFAVGQCFRLIYEKP